MLMFAVFALSALTPALPSDLLAADTAARVGPRVVASIVEASEMQRDTVYQGRNIRLSAKPNANGTWTGTARFLDDPNRIVETDASYRLQSEALSAALSRAMAEVDRDRMSRGKPSSFAPSPAAYRFFSDDATLLTLYQKLDGSLIRPHTIRHCIY